MQGSRGVLLSPSAQHAGNLHLCRQRINAEAIQKILNYNRRDRDPFSSKPKDIPANGRIQSCLREVLGSSHTAGEASTKQQPLQPIRLLLTITWTKSRVEDVRVPELLCQSGLLTSKNAQINPISPASTVTRLPNTRYDYLQNGLRSQWQCSMFTMYVCVGSI